MTLPDAAELVESLRSKTCPSCGKTKRSRQTLCFSCFGRLSGDQKKALYNLMGQGYEEAVKDAMVRLGCIEFISPRGPE